jgi:hypothetical protein
MAAEVAADAFLKGTQVTMADGTTKPVEQVDLGDEVAEGGKVFAAGKFLDDRTYMTTKELKFQEATW